MAGRVFFRDGGLHFSRLGDRGIFRADLKNLQSDLESFTGKSIPHDEFRYMAIAIATARRENKIQTPHERANRKDALAQLKAMLRLKSDDDLLHALRGCDRTTFEAVRQAQIDAISEVLWRDGVFIDAHGVEHRIPPDMECDPPYLPMGFDGVRKAIADALNSIEADQEHKEENPDLYLVALRPRIHPKVGAGNLKKDYQLDLALACWRLWVQCGQSRGAKAWCTRGTGKRSRIVDLADFVFRAAGMFLDCGRLASLLKKAK